MGKYIIELIRQERGRYAWTILRSKFYGFVYNEFGRHTAVRTVVQAFCSDN